MRRQLKEYEDDGETSAEAYDMDVALPKLWAALWTLRGWGMRKRLMAWAMFLVGTCIMARASCITKFGPLVDEGEFKEAGTLENCQKWLPTGSGGAQEGRSVGCSDPKFASPRCARRVGRSGVPSRKHEISLSWVGRSIRRVHF